ncbi:platelet endothelial cell adhesion molecule-like isoform X3 [Chiloscyllium plagiosum]|uniref:platelet endothelial cell adhesion molecule-like isoform X3 n=1 Tax=Chiloscyllium plagiosum TaxID=36176 RepID=UPI001CB7BCD7|nr:platelet endothelial cell adhesion molecule-like isoform X3 [Chiloscyllium plagiosum]
MECGEGYTFILESLQEEPRIYRLLSLTSVVAFVKPMLHVYPTSGFVKEGENLKLECGKDKAGTFYWYKNEAQFKKTQTNIYEILVNSKTGGSYSCKRHYPWFMRAPAVTVIILSKEMLTLDAKHQHALRDEKIVMNCRTPFQNLRGHKRFQWYQNNKFIKETEDGSLTIGSAKHSYEASYRCELGMSYRKWVSNNLTITVSDGNVAFHVVPVLPLEGETMKLNCRYKYNSQSERKFAFYRKGKMIHSLRSTNGESAYNIKINSVADSGLYSCKISWHTSRSVDVHVQERFAKPVLSVGPTAEVFEGFPITLTCIVRAARPSVQLHYSFYRDNAALEAVHHHGAVYTINAATANLSGNYACEVIETVYSLRKRSNSIHISVKQRFAKPVLRVEPAEVFEGLQFTLTCTVLVAWPSLQLHYWFYRDSAALQTAPDHGSVYTINSAAANVSGNYACEAINTVYGLMKRSNSIHISVKQAFTIPMLTVHPEGQLFDGQRVKLVCWIEEYPSQASLWYSFYRNEVPLQSPSDHRDYISESAHPTDSGTYHCEVTDGKVWKRSNQLYLSIRRIPVSKPELIIQPEKDLIEGDPGSLICSVSNGSLPIYYQFYNSSSVELYRELSNSTELVYNIGPISRRDEGHYHCSVRNEVTGPQHSEDIEIAVIVPVRDAVLIFFINGTEIQSGDRLVLRCRVREGTEPQFVWYRDNMSLRNGSASYQVTADGGEMVIHSFQRDDVGRYHCAAINKGANHTIFNVTSDYIEFTLRAQGYSKEIMASLLPVLLLVGLIVLWYYIHWRDTGNSSTVSQPRKSQPSGEGAAASNLEYAVVGSAHTAGNSTADLVYSEVTIKKSTEPENTTAGLVYSEVAIKKGTEPGKSIVFSTDGKKDSKTDPDESCITYAKLDLSKPSQEDDGEDGNVYMNIPRK